MLGGGSSINGQLANRGAPTDYNEWEERGASGWNWDAVLPYFKKVERDMDFDGPFHGKEGRIPVRRVFPDQWNGYSKAVAEALERKGYTYLQDQNGAFEEGYFPITMSNAYERRVSAAIGYLDPGTRLRGNLTISTETQVTELLFDGLRCTGVKALVAGKEQEFRGNQVILSSGAIHSPAHLMRAGIQTRHPARRARGHGAAQSGWRRPAADGSPGDCGRVIPASTCPAQRIFAAAHSDGLPVLVQDWRRARGVTCSSLPAENLLGTRLASRSPHC